MRLRVLVVDDDLFLLSGLRKVLERDHDVKVANDSAAARAIIDKWEPDVAFIDVLLGWDNGLDLMEEIRDQLSYTNIVAITHHPGTEIREEAFSAGADWFVGKEELALILWIVDQVEADRARGYHREQEHETKPPTPHRRK